MAKQQRNVLFKVFGCTAMCQLTADERRLFRQAARIASYYRKYERNKAQARKDASWRKLEILEVLGIPAACSKCGYDKYIGALDFHHREYHEKEKPATTVEEARKCDLLCANCHREAHRDLPRSPKHGRPPTALHPLVLKYLQVVGVTRPFEGFENGPDAEPADSVEASRPDVVEYAWSVDDVMTA